MVFLSSPLLLGRVRIRILGLIKGPTVPWGSDLSPATSCMHVVWLSCREWAHLLQLPVPAPTSIIRTVLASKFLYCSEFKSHLIIFVLMIFFPFFSFLSEPIIGLECVFITMGPVEILLEMDHVFPLMSNTPYHPKVKVCHLAIYP